MWVLIKKYVIISFQLNDEITFNYIFTNILKLVKIKQFHNIVYKDPKNTALTNINLKWNKQQKNNVGMTKDVCEFLCVFYVCVCVVSSWAIILIISGAVRTYR